MVVCNTGRGASKLLATRIMNNFPEIHIVAMKSYIDIAKDQNILDNIDLIISTIPLPKIDKPWVVVSPFLQESELTKIKEIIWVGKGQRGTAENDHFDDLVDSVIKQYKNYQDAEAFTKKVDTLLSSRYLWSNIYENDSSEQYAKVIMEIFELLSRIYPVGLNSDQFSLVSGLIAHVIMSVPRWQRGKFITAPDYHELTLKYPQEYKMISDSLQRIAKMLDIYIDDIESIAVLRYIIF
ncbi:hypothetical protein SDC9_117109 [bioreactor metagenome]|uniref:Uncharacterized protein n=1 Tax=bioreactor metagenome TaxID=1076179 RepID=A0A645BXB5_9ZZZZ